jgi:hypothetical protein
MPTPIPEWDLPRVIAQYLGKRQLNKTPTTIYQVCQRTGLSSSYVFKILEDADVVWQELCYGEERNTETTEIVLLSVPENLLIDADVSSEKLKNETQRILSKEDHDLRKFKVLRKSLMSQAQVIFFGRERGFSRTYLLEAMKNPPDPVWEPYMYGKRKYYSSKILTYLDKLRKSRPKEKSVFVDFLST